MKRLACIIISAMILTLSMLVSAAEIADVTITEEISNGEVTIKGSVKNSISDSLISVLIFEGEVADLSANTSAIFSSVDAIGEGMSSNGEFELSLLLPELCGTGRYTAFISGANMETVRKGFDYASPFAAKQKLAALNGASNATDFSTKLLSYCDEVDFDYTAINATGFDKAGFFNKLFAARPQNGFSGLEDIEKAYASCLALQTLEDLPTASEKKDFLLLNADKLQLNIDKFTVLSGDIQLLVCAKINESTCATASALQKCIDESGLLCSFEAAEVWNDFQTLIEANSQSFPLTDSEKSMLNDISDKKNVYKLMFENKPQAYTMSTVLTAYTNAIEAQYSSENSSKRPGGSGGGGGGGGRNFAVNNIPKTESADTPVQESNKLFVDLGDAKWAEEAILYLAEKGIVSGVGNGYFLPHRAITREEFVKLIVEAFGLELSAPDAGFEDVAEGAWYEKYINAAVSAGAVKGISESRFGVGETITRQDMATIIYRVGNMKGISWEGNKDVSFADSDEIAEYAAPAVSALAKAGIINGISETEFAPWGAATRAQAAKIIYQVLMLIGK